ncbi:hypothetical protein IMF27_04235 [Pseudomonas sp. PCH199]|uniref:hypothetical protein n=1 Tax=unclassified Pseudomonas TaxID=196821 RepID=UPI0015ADB613|nr:MULTISPECIES: hypothetical protein [unclassified Pseudomonas]MCW8275005.1 hypothetical protein [Pseudomonas sp. PCH199]
MREDLLHVIALGGFFFADQVEAIEGAFDKTNLRASNEMPFGGAVLVARSDLVEVV